MNIDRNLILDGFSTTSCWGLIIDDGWLMDKI